MPTDAQDKAAEDTPEMYTSGHVHAPARAVRVVPGRNGGTLTPFDSERARAAGLKSARTRRRAALRGMLAEVAAVDPEVGSWADAVAKLTGVQTFIALQPEGKRAPAAYRNVMDAISPDLEARLLRSSEPQAPAAQVLIVIGDAAAAAVGAAAARALRHASPATDADEMT